MSAPRSRAWLRSLAILWLGLLAGFATGIEWVQARPEAPPPPSGGIDLIGAGATFPYPLYRRWFAEYRAESGVRINYFSVGSGEGIRILLDEGADFGATDRPLRPEERVRTRCGPVEFPTAVGAIVVVFNLPWMSGRLRLDADVLAGIFLGDIRTWDAPPLRALNPGAALPPLPIHVVRRPRTSGTNEVFGEYLSGAAAWRRATERGGTDRPVGEQIEGNEGVAAEVRSIPGAIGFVEQAYALESHLDVAALRNVAGRYVLPDSTGLAITERELLSPETSDTVHGLIGARDPGAYPVVAMTRIVVDAALGDARRAAHLIAFVRWALRDGARSAAALGYAPLPSSVTRHLNARLDSLRPGTCPTPRTS